MPHTRKIKCIRGHSLEKWGKIYNDNRPKSKISTRRQCALCGAERYRERKKVILFAEIAATGMTI